MDFTPRHSARRALAPALSLLLAAVPAGAQLPQPLDGDRDGSLDTLEAALGSDPASDRSTPESFALADRDGNGVADACEDFRDNDGDGLADGADPGCTEPLPAVGLSAGVDVFFTRARLTGVGPSTGPVDLSGPAVVRRGVPRDGVLPVEMVALQLATDDGRVILVEDPKRRSGGEVRATDDPGAWSSRFDMRTLVVADGRVVDERTDEAVNPSISTLPPVEQETPGPIDCTGKGCYKIPNGCHCPRTPELRVPVKVYTAKFDCGQQPSTPPPFEGPVTPGLYATKIVVHNPADRRVEGRKKVSVGKRNPDTGKVSPLESFDLGANETTEIDCPDIWRLLGIEQEPGRPAPFSNGVVEVISRHELDVIGNYTQEVPKEKVEFRVWPCCGDDGPLAGIAGRRLKAVTLVTEDVVIDIEREARRALMASFPQRDPRVQAAARAHIEILGDDIGVGSSLEIEPVGVRECLLVGPSNDPRVDCSRKE